jgi:hypothetical protein
MAVVVIGEMQGGDAAQDARMSEELVQQNAPPAPGSLARFAGPTDKGWRVIAVWESEEAFRTYERERLIPLWERMGLSRPKIEVSPLASVRIAPAAAAQAAR